MTRQRGIAESLRSGSLYFLVVSPTLVLASPGGQLALGLLSSVSSAGITGGRLTHLMLAWVQRVCLRSPGLHSKCLSTDHLSCAPGSPGTCCTAQAGLRFRLALHLSCQNTEIIGTHHVALWNVGSSSIMPQKTPAGRWLSSLEY